MTRFGHPLTAFRYLAVASVLLAAIGVAGHFVSYPSITSTLGPTAYVFAANPGTEVTRLRNATLGHGVAILIGLAALATFGLWNHPSISSSGGPTFDQVGAAALAAGLTLFVLEMLGSHHAPSAATALLVASGLAKPGKPLFGLMLGLAIVLVLGPLSARLPFGRVQKFAGGTETGRAAPIGVPRHHLPASRAFERKGVR